jgi:hypothetical protein
MRVKLRFNQYPEGSILDAPEGRLGVRPRSCRLLCSVCLRRQLRGRTPRASPPTMQLSLKCNHAFPGQFSQSSSLGALSLTRMPERGERSHCRVFRPFQGSWYCYILPGVRFAHPRLSAIVPSGLENSHKSARFC